MITILFLFYLAMAFFIMLSKRVKITMVGDRPATIGERTLIAAMWPILGIWVLVAIASGNFTRKR